MVVVVEPHPVDRFIVQSPISIAPEVGLNSSINSSFPPFGPTVRNSLITMFVAGVSAVVVGVGVRVGVSVIVEVRVIVVVGVIVVVDVMVGVNVTVGVEVTVPVSVIVAVAVEVGARVFRGVGVPSVKSKSLLFVSIDPLPFRKTAVVLLAAGAAPLPSKKLAVPYPTRSTIFARSGAVHGVLPPLHAKPIVVLANITFPFDALISIAPVASGSGIGLVPDPFESNCTR